MRCLATRPFKLFSWSSTTCSRKDKLKVRILGWLALISQEALAPVQARRIQMERMMTTMRRRARFLYKRG